MQQEEHITHEQRKMANGSKCNPQSCNTMQATPSMTQQAAHDATTEKDNLNAACCNVHSSAADSFCAEQHGQAARATTG